MCRWFSLLWNFESLNMFPYFVSFRVFSGCFFLYVFLYAFYQVATRESSDELHLITFVVTANWYDELPKYRYFLYVSFILTCFFGGIDNTYPKYLTTFLSNMSRLNFMRIFSDQVQARDRSQFSVKHCGKVHFGVSQVFTLGPLLFKMFFCDTLFLFIHVDISSYVDGNTASVATDSIHEVI